MGRFNNAAKLQMEVAQLCESEDNTEEAIINYQQAADFFAIENQKSHASKALLKVAELSAFAGSYDKAIEIYESVAGTYLETNLLKSNAKKNFLLAGFCTLCTTDVVRMRQTIDKYKNMDVQFEGSRECDLLEALTQDYEDFNSEEFSTHLHGFNSIHPLGDLGVNLCLKIKEDLVKHGNETDDLM